MRTKEYYDVIEFAELIQSKKNRILFFQLDWSDNKQPCLNVYPVSGFGIIIGLPYTDAPVLNIYDYDKIDEYDLGEKLDKYFSSLSEGRGIKYDRTNIRLRGIM